MKIDKRLISNIFYIILGTCLFGVRVAGIAICILFVYS